MKKVLGVLVSLLGVLLLSWIGYNFLIERLPETQGRSPIVPLILSVGFIYVGVKWIRGQKEDSQ